MTRVFLGGTCNGSTWRESLIALLNIDYYNPVVKDWTAECQVEEIRQRETCDYVLYAITPLMTGVYSIAEAIDDSNKRPNKTLFYVANTDVAEDDTMMVFNAHQVKSLGMVSKMITANGGRVFNTLQDIAFFLNAKNKQENLEEPYQPQKHSENTYNC